MSDRLTIVIADDHPLFRKGLAEVLRREAHFEVTAEAADGKAGLAAIESFRPELVMISAGFQTRRNKTMQASEMPPAATSTMNGLT